MYIIVELIAKLPKEIELAGISNLFVHLISKEAEEIFMQRNELKQKIIARFPKQPPLEKIINGRSIFYFEN